MKSIIVAYDREYGIGADNDLLWQRDLPADLGRFKKITSGNAIIMGRKTFDSIGRALPERQNIVVTSQNIDVKNILPVASLEQAYESVDSDKEAFVIGGGQIYSAAMDTVDRILATEVDAVFPQATVFFPAIALSKWCEVNREHHSADDRNLYDYDFVTYERI